MARVCILNWTAAYHAGSAAACEALNAYLAAHEIVERSLTGQHATEDFSGADVVVCNGEGTIHHGRPLGAILIEDLARAQAAGTPTALVNATWQDNPDEWADVVNRCRIVVAREPMSVADLRGHGVERVLLFPDLSLSSVSRPMIAGPHKDRLVIGGPGAAGRTDVWESVEARYPHDPRVLLRGRTFQSVVDELAGAAIYITGEYHGLNAAAAAGVPVNIHRSNSWKIESTLGWYAERGHWASLPDWLWHQPRMVTADLAPVLQ